LNGFAAGLLFLLPTIFQRYIAIMIGVACNSRFPQAKEGGITGGSLYSSLHQKWSKLGTLFQKNVNEEDNEENIQNF
jgi:hypothetical protein